MEALLVEKIIPVLTHFALPDVDVLEAVRNQRVLAVVVDLVVVFVEASEAIQDEDEVRGSEHLQEVVFEGSLLENFSWLANLTTKRGVSLAVVYYVAQSALHLSGVNQEVVGLAHPTRHVIQLHQTVFHRNLGLHAKTGHFEIPRIAEEADVNGVVHPTLVQGLIRGNLETLSSSLVDVVAVFAQKTTSSRRNGGTVILSHKVAGSVFKDILVFGVADSALVVFGALKTSVGAFACEGFK